MVGPPGEMGEGRLGRCRSRDSGQLLRLGASYRDRK